MIRNTLSHWKDRSHSSLSEEEIGALTDEQYNEYLTWRIQVNLKLMEAEGFITSFTENGETFYRLKTDEELQQEIEAL
jgi:hypothetical protein